MSPFSPVYEFRQKYVTRARTLWGAALKIALQIQHVNVRGITVYCFYDTTVTRQ